MMFGFFKKKRKTFSFECSECGEEHSGSPSFSHKYPAQFFDVPEALRGEYVTADSDFCYIKPFPGGPNEYPSWFIRVILEVPIVGVAEPFTWGVWVSLSKEKFEEYFDGFGSNQQEFHSFAWLTLNLPYYKSYDENDYLEALPCNVVGRIKGLRPLIYLQESDHQLYKDQVLGISWKKAVEIAELCMHP